MVICTLFSQCYCALRKKIKKIFNHNKVECNVGDDVTNAQIQLQIHPFGQFEESEQLFKICRNRMISTLIFYSGIPFILYISSFLHLRKNSFWIAYWTLISINSVTWHTYLHGGSEQTDDTQRKKEGQTHKDLLSS